MKLFLKRTLFYILSFTWGGLMSIIGLLVMLVTLPFGKTYIYHGRIYKRIGKGWGGLELGCFFLCSENSSEHTLAHEAGHGLQNCIWGPLFPFVVCIPSAIRYWIFNFNTPAKKSTFCSYLISVIWACAAVTMIIPVLTGNML